MFGDTPHSSGILFVCTGNICRSPYAERRLRQLLPDAGVPITSAGTGALVGHAIEPETADELRRRGADVTGFAARAATPALVKDAGLVLTLTRAHRAEVARLSPASMRRIFALGDFADLCRSSGTWRPIAPSQPWLPQVVAEAAAARGTIAPREPDEVDVVDPYRRSAATHAQAWGRIEELLDAVVMALSAVSTSSRTGPVG